jgi:hypothetical protein
MDEWDAYFWPNSNVLKNKAGLTRAAPLQGRFTQTAYSFGPVELNVRRPGNPSG